MYLRCLLDVYDLVLVQIVNVIVFVVWEQVAMIVLYQ